MDQSSVQDQPKVKWDSILLNFWEQDCITYLAMNLSSVWNPCKYFPINRILRPMVYTKPISSMFHAKTVRLIETCTFRYLQIRLSSYSTFNKIITKSVKTVRLIELYAK